MAKSEPKTMRFEDDVERYINVQAGENFSEKFHKLVRFIKDSEPEKHKKLAALDRDIKVKEQRIKELSEYLSGASWLERNFQDLSKSIENCKESLEKFVIRN